MFGKKIEAWATAALTSSLLIDISAQIPGEVILFLAILILFVVVVLFMLAVRIIQPYEQGLKVVLGKYKPPPLNPGFNLVAPLVTQVTKLDLRTQVLDVPRQEVITKDNSPTNVDAIIYIKVTPRRPTSRSRTTERPRWLSPRPL